MTAIGTLPGERLAGLSEDLFCKVRKGVITLDELALFVQRKNPFPYVNRNEFNHNKHGHAIITFTGNEFTGKQEIKRLEDAGYHLSDYAKQCFLSTANDCYDGNHRLLEGKSYTLALVPDKEIVSQSDRTTIALRKLGEKYGYGKPLAGHVPRIREVLSDEQMKELGIRYVVSLHEPIKNSDGRPLVLRAHRGDDGQWVGACWDRPGRRWSDHGAFAFPVSAD